MTAVLAGSDFLRTPLLATAQPEGFKEWHHFVIHGAGRRLLINFNLTSEPSRTGQPTGTTCHRHRPRRAVDRSDRAVRRVRAGHLRRPRHHHHRRQPDGRAPDGYQVVIDLPKQGIQGELQFTSVSRPFVVNNQPLGEGRMCWLFVPKLRADGWLRIGGHEHRIDGELAYHDHNWGRFWWGDDFGWTWGTMLSQTPGNPGRSSSCR